MDSSCDEGSSACSPVSAAHQRRVVGQCAISLHEEQPGLLGSKVRLRLLQRSVAQTCWIPLMLQCLAGFQDSPQLRAHLIL